MSEDGQPFPELEPESRLRRMPGVAWRIVEEEAILVNVRRDEVIHLDRVASFIWSKMDGAESLEEIAGDLIREFDVEMDEALADTVVFAERLLNQGAAEIARLEE
jgi:Coenzyme PQQ synthesis protein D (PqqD)